MSTRIVNIETLREHAIDTLNKIECKEVELGEAAITAKLYDSIIASLKTEMDYQKMIGETKAIKFLESNPQLQNVYPALGANQKRTRGRPRVSVK